MCIRDSNNTWQIVAQDSKRGVIKPLLYHRIRAENVLSEEDVSYVSKREHDVFAECKQNRICCGPDKKETTRYENI